MNKKATTTIIILLTTLVIALSIFLYALIKNNYSFNNFPLIFSNYSENLIASEEFDDITNIVIDNKVADIFIEENSNDKISVEIYSNNNYEHSITQDDVLNITLKSKKMNFLFAKTNRIIVKIPKTYDKLINIESSVGDIKIDSFDSLTANIKLGTGDIKIDSIKDLNISLGTGDIEIESINTLTGKKGTGDVEIEKIDNFDITSGVGNIKINNLNNKISLTKTIGDVKINNLNIKENSTIKGTVGDIRIDNQNNIYVSGNNRIGDIRIKNNNKDSNVVLDIDITTGDIKVN